MDQARIVMVSPLPELTRLARQISRELSFKMGIVEAFLDKGVELGKRLEPVSYTHLDVYKRQGGG